MADPAACDSRHSLDPGIALFAGLNGLEADLGGDSSFDLDFHTIPSHRKYPEASVEKHDVSKRSRRQKGILAFLARDTEARLFC